MEAAALMKGLSVCRQQEQPGGGALGPPDLTQEATVSPGNYGLQGRLLPAVESRDLKHFGSKTFQDIHLEVFGFLVNQEGDL